MDSIPTIYVVLGGVSGALLGAGVGTVLHRGNPAKYPRWAAVLFACVLAAVCAASAARYAVGTWLIGIPLLLLIGAAPVLLWAGVGVLAAIVIGRRR